MKRLYVAWQSPQHCSQCSHIRGGSHLSIRTHQLIIAYTEVQLIELSDQLHGLGLSADIKSNVEAQKWFILTNVFLQTG